MRTFITIITMAVIIIGCSSLAYADDEGKDVFHEYKCNKCHPISAYGISAVKGEKKDEEEEDDEDDGDKGKEEGKPREPKDLSDVGTRRDKKFLFKYLTKKIDIDGRKHKRRFKGSKKEFEQLIAWLLTLKKPPIVPAEEDKK